MASTRRKSAAIAIAVIGVAGLSLAAAAQLNIESDSLSAAAVEIDVCDDDGVDLSYTTAFEDGAYIVKTVTVEGVDNAATGCLGQDVGVAVQGVEITPDQEVIGTKTDYVFTVAADVTAESLTDAAVIIH